MTMVQWFCNHSRRATLVENQLQTLCLQLQTSWVALRNHDVVFAACLCSIRWETSGWRENVVYSPSEAPLVRCQFLNGGSDSVIVTLLISCSPTQTLFSSINLSPWAIFTGKYCPIQCIVPHLQAGLSKKKTCWVFERSLHLSKGICAQLKWENIVLAAVFLRR